MFCRSKRPPKQKKMKSNKIIPLFKNYSYILAFFSVLCLAPFFYPSECLAYVEPVWSESFEDFPSDAISINNYANYTSNLNDRFYPIFETGWFSSWESSDGNFSVRYHEASPLSPYFVWNAGIPILRTPEVQGGELFFDFYVSNDLCSPTTNFSFTFGDQTLYNSGPEISTSALNYGEWNSIEFEWYFDYFEDNRFVVGTFINGGWYGLTFGDAPQDEVTGLFVYVNESLSCSNGYVLLDNFRMFDSVDVVDPEEEPPEEEPIVIENWEDYYNFYSDKFATSTPLFMNMANTFTPIVNKMGEFTLFATDYFNISDASQKGENLGDSIPQARAYLIVIDDFIGLPLASLLVFYFLSMAVVISYKIILAIIKLLKP